jgi:hypothetical protein
MFTPTTPLDTFKFETRPPHQQTTCHEDSINMLISRIPSFSILLWFLEVEVDWHGVRMGAKKPGAHYLVELKHFGAEVIRKWRTTEAIDQEKLKVMKVKVLGLVPGTRTYDCELVGSGEG